VGGGSHVDVGGCQAVVDVVGHQGEQMVVGGVVGGVVGLGVSTGGVYGVVRMGGTMPDILQENLLCREERAGRREKEKERRREKKSVCEREERERGVEEAEGVVCGWEKIIERESEKKKMRCAPFAPF